MAFHKKFMNKLGLSSTKHHLSSTKVATPAHPDELTYISNTSPQVSRLLGDDLMIDLDLDFDFDLYDLDQQKDSAGSQWEDNDSGYSPDQQHQHSPDSSNKDTPAVAMDTSLRSNQSMHVHEYSVRDIAQVLCDSPVKTAERIVFDDLSPNAHNLSPKQESFVRQDSLLLTTIQVQPVPSSVIHSVDAENTLVIKDDYECEVEHYSERAIDVPEEFFESAAAPLGASTPVKGHQRSNENDNRAAKKNMNLNQSYQAACHDEMSGSGSSQQQGIMGKIRKIRKRLQIASS